MRPSSAPAVRARRVVHAVDKIKANTFVMRAMVGDEPAVLKALSLGVDVNSVHSVSRAHCDCFLTCAVDFFVVTFVVSDEAALCCCSVSPVVLGELSSCVLMRLSCRWGCGCWPGATPDCLARRG
jgi:hypothetical protein